MSIDSVCAPSPVPEKLDHEWLRRVRQEYLEMPGLCLTLAQAGRLWCLDSPTCSGVLETLRRERFLTVGSDGRYSRSDAPP